MSNFSVIDGDRKEGDEYFRPSRTDTKLTVIEKDGEYKPHPNGWGLVHKNSFVEGSVRVDQSSKVGPGCFITGDVALLEGTYVKNCRLSGSLQISASAFENLNLDGNAVIKKRRIQYAR